jgi:LysR family nitrogen assimilation transcriptional regulator
MDIKQLTYFSAVFEFKNLSHAASRHNVAQSAISHHISNLEAELGVSLFIRKSRGMEPTAAGNRLYSHAKKILLSVKSAKQDVMRESKEIAGEIAIGLPFSVMKGIGLLLMETILRDFPKVRLTIVEGLSEITHSNLISSEVDFAFFYNPQKDMHITMELVLEEEVMCVGKPSIIGDSDQPITFDQLATLPVLLLRHGASSRALIDRPGLLSKLEANASLQLNSISGITNGMLAGMGCTIAPKIFVKEQLSAGLLHARRVMEPELSRRLYIGYRRDYPSNRLFEAIKQMTVGLIESNVRNNEWEATLAENLET